MMCCAVLSCAGVGCCHSLPQEYNICFTTVKRPTDGSMPALPTAANGAGSGSLAPLPTVIQGLVRKRREVKAQMKTCRYGVQKGPLLLGMGALLGCRLLQGCMSSPQAVADCGSTTA